MAIISKSCDHNFETGRGSFKFRPYTGAVKKLNKKNVEKHNKEREEFLETLREEGNQLSVPNIESYKSLPEAIACYTSVVANSIGCNKEQRDQIMKFKTKLHEWIEMDGKQ
jgi:uncharacterized protein YaaR (DUF327 family)